MEGLLICENLRYSIDLSGSESRNSGKLGNQRSSILMTGASGLLGGAMLTWLGPSRRVHLSIRKLPQQPLPPNAAVVVHDLQQRQELRLPEEVETIVHLAQSPRYRDFPKGAFFVYGPCQAKTMLISRLMDVGANAENAIEGASNVGCN
jgi:hypothetical protein